MNVAVTGMRVVVATRPVDFRKGHDGLAAVVEHELGLDPYSGVAVVFRPKRMDRMKVLWWDGTGAGNEASVLGWRVPSLGSRLFATVRGATLRLGRAVVFSGRPDRGLAPPVWRIGVLHISILQNMMHSCCLRSG